MFKTKLDKASQTVNVSYKVEGENWTKALAKSKATIAKTIKIPGFRVGKKIPQSVLDKHISQYNVVDRALNDVVKEKRFEAYQEALKTAKNIYHQPNINVLKVDDKELEFEYAFVLLPDFSDLKFDGLKTKYHVEKFSEKMVDALIEEKLSQLAMLKTKKGAAKLGDTVVIDFKGFINDEAFEGGQAEKFELKLGSNQFIPGFEDQLVGKQAGWKGDIKVMFPETYYVKEYKGKEAVFEILLHEVKSKDTPELTVELLPIFGMPGLTTVKELRDALTLQVKFDMVHRAKEKFLQDLVEEIIVLNKVTLHEMIYAQRVKSLNDEFNKSLKDNGIKRAEYLEVTKATEEDIMKELKTNAEKEVKTQHVTSALFEKFSVKPTEKEIEDEYARIAKENGLSLQDTKQHLPVDRITLYLENNTFFNNLMKKFDPEGLKSVEKFNKEREAELQKVRKEAEQKAPKKEANKTETKKEKPAVKKEAKPKKETTK
ncbi:trigger factor [Mycoplasmopsis alligatoris]|uniref:Trigger factor n=1 Tax=Mycoplasmopsis alligatoris A21JP2 TaxID=747682 RepID=D4XWS7_9BACT|nr:trigger factor [Mycoplasmopsis alligatoris]EFF41207.1 trigger factor [Mycoplasmopsis alligatoris A21JP2]